MRVEDSTTTPSKGPAKRTPADSVSGAIPGEDMKLRRGMRRLAKTCTVAACLLIAACWLVSLFCVPQYSKVVQQGPVPWYVRRQASFIILLKGGCMQCVIPRSVVMVEPGWHIYRPQ